MQLRNYCPEVKVLRLCSGGEEGIEAIESLAPDLVFLDIEMPKVNGFDVLDQTRGLHYKVIFTTAYDQFAIKAFKYSAMDYLLKPIDIEDLKAAVKKIDLNQKDDLGTKLRLLYSQLGLKSPQPSRISLPFGEAYEMVPFALIIRCESESNYTTFYLSDKRKVTLSKTLKEVEETMMNDSFFRVHHSHMINIEHIVKFYKTDGGYVIMSDGTQISISRNKKDQFFELLKKV
ncbi:MAG: response regulator transcription factor [Saprospiraceae bacterium]|nr:response regulator transcription factor [Saprospiraceae bacterium]